VSQTFAWRQVNGGVASFRVVQAFAWWRVDEMDVVTRFVTHGYETAGRPAGLSGRTGRNFQFPDFLVLHIMSNYILYKQNAGL
jgi:hypothetical protein